MTEIRCAAAYFKQDAIALRRCILYEFVQEKPVHTAYVGFCEKFSGFSGKSRKVIEKEEFEYWFDQFKQGKFDDDKETVTDMKEFLRSDKNALRACVLSEKGSYNALNGRIETHGGFILPYITDDCVKSFKKYIHFREVLGKDAMDYREFRFWMHRFSRGEFDLGFEGPMDFKAADVDFNKCDKYLEMLDRLSDMFKDPIILRYCILFEFFEHRPIKKVFKNFRRKIGEKLMDFDTFKYWFKQFKQGIFDDNKEPVADMRDILRNDQRALRICVLYVSLNYNIYRELFGQSVKWMEDHRFPVYSLFCDIIGEDVMKYEEFVYWQIRFSDGNFDLDHERSEKALELTDMPIDIMKDLVQYLSIVDRAMLRRTSKALHVFIDSQPLLLKEISFRPENCDGSYSWRIEIESNSNETHSIIYTDNQQNYYPIEADFESRLVDREDYEKCAIEDWKLIVQTPNLHAEHLDIKTDEIDIRDYFQLDYDIPTQNEQLDGLASVIDPSAKLHIKCIHIKSTVLEPIVDFLSYLEPGYLNCISLDSYYTHDTGFLKMLELEQFKQAKKLKMCPMPFTDSIRDFLHLDSFRVDMATFSAEDFRILREVAFKSSTFEYCFLRLGRKFDFDVIRRELGDSLVPGIHENTFRHIIPNTKDCFEISIDQGDSHFKRIAVSKKKDYREEDRRQMEMNNRFGRIQM